MSTLVMKFGGSLTADAKRITRVAQVILAETLAWKRMVVVVSAMAGATDALNRAVDLAVARDAAGYRRAVAGLREEHVAVITALFDDEAVRRDLIDHIDRLLFDVLNVCDAALVRREALPRERDQAMAAGERMMVYILTALVRQEGLRAAMVDAASLIVTDDRYQNANPLVDLTDERVDAVLRPILDAGIVPLVTGFVGATRGGVTTTLGRGGSDYTATILAASLHADEVWIWTNVDGVMSADPALVPGARVIPVLSYEEVGELSYFGAHVLHPRAVEPLALNGIPLRVRNPFNLDHAGTLIQAETAESPNGLKAVTAVDGVCLTTSGRPIDMSEFLAQLRGILGQMATGPVIVMQSHLRSTLVFVVPTTAGPTAVAAITQRLAAALGAERWQVSPVKVIAVMGSTAQPILANPTSGAAIRPLASVIGPGERRLIAVAPSDTQAVVRQLHKLTSQTISAPGSWLA
jgi:bifunctional aspartokinase / homoserine dehydrogenase 1